jgi:hypothetical protein
LFPLAVQEPSRNGTPLIRFPCSTAPSTPVAARRGSTDFFFLLWLLPLPSFHKYSYHIFYNPPALTQCLLALFLLFPFPPPPIPPSLLSRLCLSFIAQANLFFAPVKCIVVLRFQEASFVCFCCRCRCRLPSTSLVTTTSAPLLRLASFRTHPNGNVGLKLRALYPELDVSRTTAISTCPFTDRLQPRPPIHEESPRRVFLTRPSLASGIARTETNCTNP